MWITNDYWFAFWLQRCSLNCLYNCYSVHYRKMITTLSNKNDYKYKSEFNNIKICVFETFTSFFPSTLPILYYSLLTCKSWYFVTRIFTSYFFVKVLHHNSCKCYFHFFQEILLCAVSYNFFTSFWFYCLHSMVMRDPFNFNHSLVIEFFYF